jgi:xanthine dehydrogenase YagR molybdenum-binding subunit
VDVEITLRVDGSAAAITNAAYHATGIRVRDLPLTLDKFLEPRTA